MHKYISDEIKKSVELFSRIAADEVLQNTAATIAKICINTLKTQGKILFAGNGGSAADAQHLAAELVSRYSYNRPALAGIALTTDTSALTAIGNDYSYEYLFARQIEALGRPGDVFIGITTSGKSPNILLALETAKAKGLHAIGFTRDDAPLMTERCDIVLNIPSRETPKIQEGHIALGHIICALIEEQLFGEQYNPQKQALVT